MKNIYTHAIQKLLLLCIATLCCSTQHTAAMQTTTSAAGYYAKKASLMCVSAAIIGTQQLTGYAIKKGIVAAAHYITPKLLQQSSTSAKITLFCVAAIAKTPTLITTIIGTQALDQITSRIKIFENIQSTLTNHCNKDETKTVKKTVRAANTFTSLYMISNHMPLLSKYITAISLRYTIPVIALISLLINPKKILKAIL